MLYAFGQIFIDANGQMLENKISIWSHCPSSTSQYTSQEWFGKPTGPCKTTHFEPSSYLYTHTLHNKHYVLGRFSKIENYFTSLKLQVLIYKWLIVYWIGPSVSDLTKITWVCDRA